MNKLGMVLGLAAVAAIAGCKDPNWNRGNSHANAAKNVATDVEATPINAEETKSPETTTAPVVEEEKHCTCAPGTVHDLPCACGANDCRCIVMKNDKKPAPPPEPEYTVYIVQRGDYIAKISKKFNVTIDSIKRLNNLKSDKILLGQKLKLPGKLDVGEQTVPAGAVKESPKAKKTYASYTGPTKEYVVKNGDTLGAIAYGNGINIRQLKELNGLDKDSLRVGQKLKIPAEKVQKPQSKAAAAPAPKAEKKAEAPVAAPAPVAEQPASAETDAQATDAATVNPVVEETAPVVEAPAEAITYRVQEGEDLADVSIRWGVSAAAVRELNNLSEDDVLKPGQILRLPADAQQN